MAIITEQVIINEREFMRTYSDAGYMIERDGARYSEAVDPLGTGRVYVETDELIEVELEPEPEPEYLV